MAEQMPSLSRYPVSLLTTNGEDAQPEVIVAKINNSPPDNDRSEGTAVNHQVQPTTTEVIQECVDLRERQLCDHELREIVNYLENGELPTEEKMVHALVLSSAQFAMVDGVIYHLETDKTLRLVPPVTERYDLFQEAHAGPFSGPKSIVNIIGGLECVVTLLNGAVHVCPVLRVELDIRSDSHSSSWTF